MKKETRLTIREVNELEKEALDILVLIRTGWRFTEAEQKRIDAKLTAYQNLLQNSLKSK